MARKRAAGLEEMMVHHFSGQASLEIKYHRDPI